MAARKKAQKASAFSKLAAALEGVEELNNAVSVMEKLRGKQETDIEKMYNALDEAISEAQEEMYALANRLEDLGIYVR